MKSWYNTLASAASVAISLSGLIISAELKSPPLISTSSVSLILSALYLYEIRKGKRINTLIPICQSLSLAITIILTFSVTTESYPGFRLGVIPYPIIGGATIACLIGYAGLKFYRELIMTFIVFMSCAISNFTCVVVYALYESEFDHTVTNALNTQELAAGVVWSTICIVIFWMYSRHVTKARFYDESKVLEAPE